MARAKQNENLPEHYFSKTQFSKLKIREIAETIRGVEVRIKLGSGTFSSLKIDIGSRLLAEKMEIKPHDNVLDLGCGTGIAGIVASYLTDGAVVLTDINERACMLAKENSMERKNISVLCGNMYEPVKERKFDAIILNPPHTAGKDVCFRMIEEAKEHLNIGGSLQVVARHNKGGETLSRHMNDSFGNVKAFAKKGRYRVYISVVG